jgi:outer membrane protein TolC
VLDAQRDLLTPEQQLVQTRRALLSSQVACTPPWAAAPCRHHVRN